MVAEVSLNYIAIIVSGVVAMIIGYLWYGPLFGKAWMKLSGFTPKDQEKAKKKGMTKSYIIMFIGVLVTAYVLAHFVDYMEATTFLAGMEVGCWLWLGFIAPVMLGMVLWEGKPVKLYLLNVIYQLIVIELMAGILAVWA